jgi:hypothetical protein
MASEQIDLLVTEIVEYEISQVHALKDLIRAREEIANNIYKLQKKLYTLQSLAPDKQEKQRCDRCGVPG